VSTPFFPPLIVLEAHGNAVGIHHTEWRRSIAPLFMEILVKYIILAYNKKTHIKGGSA
jgi:hypothetical protein